MGCITLTVPDTEGTCACCGCCTEVDCGILMDWAVSDEENWPSDHKCAKPEAIDGGEADVDENEDPPEVECSENTECGTYRDYCWTRNGNPKKFCGTCIRFMCLSVTYNNETGEYCYGNPKEICGGTCSGRTLEQMFYANIGTEVYEQQKNMEILAVFVFFGWRICYRSLDEDDFDGWYSDFYQCSDTKYKIWTYELKRRPDTGG